MRFGPYDTPSHVLLGRELGLGTGRIIVLAQPAFQVLRLPNVKLPGIVLENVDVIHGSPKEKAPPPGLEPGTRGLIPTRRDCSTD